MSNNATSWIPGASDFLGYGVNIFGNYYHPVLKDQFLDFTPYDLPTAQWSDQEIVPKSAAFYKLPASIAFSNISAAHGETIVAESKMMMSEKLSAQANAQVSYGGFTGTVKTSYQQFDDTEADRWFCLTDGSQKVYSLLARNLDPSLLHKQVKTKDIYQKLMECLTNSQPCSQNEEPYFAFFEWYGTHVITGVEMGGGLQIFTSVEKSYVKTAQEVETSAEAEYTGVFQGGGGANWKQNNQTWLANRNGTIDAYGGDSGTPLLAKVMSGVLPTTDMSADLAKWAASVPQNPTMVNLQLTKIGDLFETQKQRDLVNEAFDRYANSYLSLSYANKQSVLEWRGQPVALAPMTSPHKGPSSRGPRGPSRFQGWCVINRTTGAVEAVIPFEANTADQSVPADLSDPNTYKSNNHILLFMHWESTWMDDAMHWTEIPFNGEVAQFLRQCGGGKVLQDYNSMGRTQSGGGAYFQGYYVLCGVIDSGPGKGKEFTNIYQPQVHEDIVIPLTPQPSEAGFLLSLLDFG